ncbi:MAG: RluA family pseudouridine synthase [Lautropia sp.]|nr:RluA family pseudouridine synthase [Lautropia sp.]
MPDYSQASAAASPTASGRATEIVPALAPDAVADDNVVVLRLVARGAAGQRLDQFLAAQLDGVSRTRVQRWIVLGAVRVDQTMRLPSYRLNGHEEIEVEPQSLESEQAFCPDPVPLDILYRDDDLVVINKPAGLVTHPAPGNWRNTLMNGLLFANPASSRLPRAGIVHRLDRDTSGVLVCAQSERAFTSLSAQLSGRTMSRQYLAIVTGAIDESGTVASPIGRDPRNRLRMAVLQGPHGKPAQTDYRMLARSAAEQAARPHAALECRLRSGRTHQIRVHLASIGHPLVGDPTYGGECVAGFDRQALHAWRLSLQHPATGKTLSVDCPIPEDLLHLAARLGLRLDPLAPAPGVSA